MTAYTASKKPLLTLSVIAATDVTAYSPLTYAGSIAGAGVAVYGFAITDAVAGDAVGVDVQGTTIAVSGAAIANGAQLEVGSGGRLITHNTGIAVARALSAVSAAGIAFEVLLLSN
ncbi:MAG: DUF2190 family protein [Methylovulum sp.]|nr:DUF2190 family protein [Methylovulum sp.]